MAEVTEQSGLLVDRSGEMGFSHLAFQEHLTACELKDRMERAEAVNFLVMRRSQPWWREGLEVILLYAAVVPDVSPLAHQAPRDDRELFHSRA